MSQLSHRPAAAISSDMCICFMRKGSVVDCCAGSQPQCGSACCCRIFRHPSLACAAAAGIKQHQQSESISEPQAPAVQPAVLRSVQLRSTYYLVNPAGDLPETEEAFAGWFQELGWQASCVHHCKVMSCCFSKGHVNVAPRPPQSLSLQLIAVAPACHCLPPDLRASQN